MEKRKFIKTRAGSYVPESMVIKDGISPAKSLTHNIQSKVAVPEKESLEDQVVNKVKRQTESDTLEDDKYLNEIPLEKSNRKIYLLGLIVLILVSILVVAVFFLRTKVPVQKSEEVALDIEESSTTDTESDNETGGDDVVVEENQQLNRSDIKIEILNGSGTPGLAGLKKEIFSDLGYNVVKIGNSAVTEGNKVYLQKDFEDKVDVLLDDLKDELDIASISGVVDSEDVNARIILGK